MTIAPITAHDAHKAIADGKAVLIDVREPHEHARESIPGSVLVPLSRLKEHEFSGLVGPDRIAVFHCQSGARTCANMDRFRMLGLGEARILDGGLAAWKRAGFPTAFDRSKPIELQRQVQIAAGALVVAGLALGTAESPWFLALSAFMGAGLIFAGVSGWCGLARFLALMPWNRKAA